MFIALCVSGTMQSAGDPEKTTQTSSSHSQRSIFATMFEPSPFLQMRRVVQSGQK